MATTRQQQCFQPTENLIDTVHSLSSFTLFSRGFNKQPPEVLLKPQLLLPHQGNCLLANEMSKILDLQGIMGCPVFPQNCVLFVFPSHLPNCPGNSG